MASVYPQIVEYNEAVQHPATAFLDSDLRQGQVAANVLGLPIALSGGFALTYMVSTPQRKFAVRCFHRQVPEVEAKYAAISRAVSSLKSNYFVDFTYLGRGIRVAQNVYPVVKMAWVEGDPLGIWLDKHYNDPQKIKKARADFQALAKFLEAHGLAHGDIQNGNVMISPSGVKLIDYDGMYVPGLPLGSGSETGHKHFQHPDRTTKTFGPKMDRFAFCAIDLSLRAIAEDPSLHPRFREGGETIVFRANDFVDPANSQIFAELRKRSSLKPFADAFASICEADISAVPSLEDFVHGRNLPRTGGAAGINGDTSPQRPTPPRPSGYISTYPVLSADDFAGVMQAVGNRVELIGQITGVKQGVGKKGKGKGKPFVFVNFGHWRGDIVKLTIWSEGLAQLVDAPDEAWVGKWVSVVGLVDEPYKGKHYAFHYTHVGITIESSHQINVLNEKEAKFRLTAPSSGTAVPEAGTPHRSGSQGAGAQVGFVNGYPTPTSPTATTKPQQTSSPANANSNKSNSDILGTITGRKANTSNGSSPPPAKVPPRNITSPPTVTQSPGGPANSKTNAEILKAIRTGSQQHQSPSNPPTPPAAPTSVDPFRRHPSQPAAPPTLMERIFRWFWS